MGQLANKGELCANAKIVANHFRLGFEGEANALLVELIDNIVSSASSLSPTATMRLERLCAKILTAQQRADAIFIADALEYELKTVFENN